MRFCATCACLILGGLSLAHSEVKLPAIFSDHMVLQKAGATPVWGKAAAGERVTVTMDGQNAGTSANKDGKWRVVLDLSHSGAGPFEMVIESGNRVVIHDVIVGQTWLISGQSNAEFMLKESADAAAEVARSSNGLLRQFKVEKKTSDVPRDDAGGMWVLASPTTADEFSAVGYYFGKKLQAELNQPVGIINASWGGTFIEAWMSEDAINADPELRDGEAKRRNEMTDFVPQKAAYVKAFGEWLKTHEREDRPCPNPVVYADAQVSTEDWSPVSLPGNVSGPNLPQNGAIWIRREIEVPAAVEGLVIKASLGQISAFEATYWNGHKIFELPYDKLPGDGYTHYFAIPQADVHPGKAVIAIRLYAPVSAPALSLAAERFAIGPIHLAGPWLAKAEYSLPPISAEIAASAPKPPRQPPSLKASGIFNGVLNPIIPYGISGIIWYQGESNAGTAWQYLRTLPLFIRDLRARWDQPELPFYICQLPNYLPKLPAPAESAWAELRESQSAASTLPHNALAVLMGLGESEDIHPRNKADVGERLVRIALAQFYGRSGLEDSGPVYESMSVESSKIRVKFTHAGHGLIAKPLPKIYDVKTLLKQTAPLVPNCPGSELEGFAICGPDHHWVWANAKIEGPDVLVWSDQVPAPVAVRYAWADNPTCNLYNAADLPAAPFRTDRFSTTTDNYRFGLSPSGRY